MSTKKHKFKIEPLEEDSDKNIQITGPVQLKVDFDDVDHRQVKIDAVKLVRILNRFWGRTWEPDLRLQELLKELKARRWDRISPTDIEHLLTYFKDD